MRILAIDPGPHTGFARWERTPGGESIQQWTIDKPMDAIATVRDELLNLDVVVCEDFIIRGARGSEANTTIEIIGAVRWLCHANDCPFVLQAPADAAAFVDNNKLKKLGWWKVGEDHSRSATKHLVLFMVRSALIHPAQFA